MFILKLFMLSLTLSITGTNSKPTNNNKLISHICPKTKNPNLCLDILSLDPYTRSASSLHILGLGSVAIAIHQAQFSEDLFSRAYDKKNIGAKEKGNYRVCRNHYVLATNMLRQARNAWIKHDYALARKNIEVAHKVPISCEDTLFGKALPIAAAKRWNSQKPKITFDIALVIVKELEGGSKLFDQGYLRHT